MSFTPTEVQTSPAERALVLGIRLYRLAGVLLLAFFLIETFGSLGDLRLRDPISELKFSSQMTDRIPLSFLGIIFLPAVLAGFYLLLIPLAMNASANLFRNASYGLTNQVEEQVKKVRAVLNTTLSLTPEQQQGMVDRYNQANPKKQSVDLTGFLKTLRDEVKASEERLEAERKSVLQAQKKNLYSSQFLQALKCLLGSVCFFFLWKNVQWIRRSRQSTLGKELATRHRQGQEA